MAIFEFAILVYNSRDFKFLKIVPWGLIPAEPAWIRLLFVMVLGADLKSNYIWPDGSYGLFLTCR
jgi:hypothetical protein